MQLTFRIENAKVSSLPAKATETAVARAFDFAVSAAALPVRFEYPGWPHNPDPDPNGEPSYVNVQALQRAWRVRMVPSAGGVKVSVELAVLEAFAKSAVTLSQTNHFARYLAWSMASAGMEKRPSSNIVDVRVTT